MDETGATENFDLTTGITKPQTILGATMAETATTTSTTTTTTTTIKAKKPAKGEFVP